MHRFILTAKIAKCYIFLLLLFPVAIRRFGWTLPLSRILIHSVTFRRVKTGDRNTSMVLYSGKAYYEVHYQLFTGKVVAVQKFYPGLKNKSICIGFERYVVGKIFRYHKNIDMMKWLYLRKTK